MESNPALPRQEIQRLYPPGQWEKLRTMSYAAYVLVEGDIVDDEFRARTTAASFPDHSYDQIAYDLLRQVRLKPATVGTHLPPTATACVILYPKGLDGSLALIYAKQTNYDDTPDVAIARFFRAQHY